MIITFLVPIALVALDQFTKWLATTYLAPIGTAPFIPGIMHFEYVINDGAAFNLFAGKQVLLTVVTGIALAVLLCYLLFKNPKSKLEYIAWLLVLAGGVGNLINRILEGFVVDFFATSFMNFAVFNVADIYVVIGMALVLIAVFKEERAASKLKKAGEKELRAAKEAEDVNTFTPEEPGENHE